MPRVPTVELAHRRNGDVRIVNLSEYSFDLGRWSDWSIVSVRRGDAPDDRVRTALREWKINTHRLHHPAEQARRKDHERAYLGRRIEVRTPTRPEADWRAMPWYEARSYVKQVTGTEPRDKAHAVELMQNLG